MNALSFVYWLQGYFELHENYKPTLSEDQVDVIREHIALVLKKETCGKELSPTEDCGVEIVDC